MEGALPQTPPATSFSIQRQEAEAEEQEEEEVRKSADETDLNDSWAGRMPRCSKSSSGMNQSLRCEIPGRTEDQAQRMHMHASQIRKSLGNDATSEATTMLLSNVPQTN